MNPIAQLQDDIAKNEADADFYEACAKRCRSEAALLREELENERDGKPQLMELARRLAETILCLDGLTGAEIEAAENALTDEPVNIHRLREIAQVVFRKALARLELVGLEERDRQLVCRARGLAARRRRLLTDECGEPTPQSTMTFFGCHDYAATWWRSRSRAMSSPASLM